MPNFRLLSVHAHPDDESSKGAATLAHYASLGVEILVVTCTGGERGDLLNPALDRPEVRADLPAIRRREMAEAARILGVRQHFLGFPDSGLPANGEELPQDCFATRPLTEVTAALVRQFREFRPHVVLTYDETGGYPHPDHLRTHEVTLAALAAAPVANQFPEAGTPWQPSKLYYHARLSRAWFQTLHEAILASGRDSAMGEVLVELPPEPPHPITTKIHCPEHFATRDRALRAHATQSDPAHPFFAHPRDLEREVWPTEDYHLAWSTVPTTIPESDLFAGLRD
ncbi:mycothiol conjugate amidase Mca [Crossiella sp. SN42]|uniref:mycothiol conjugate amidase Mca n=1 Tax=Crossiella sp. SN42 TaxID=2944808 RepID=UPI00207D131C|nr:mycothiol conjugate amidase Mca [Crossiella sp. SN42]MCO1577471.1 mycothiol conjugate amidase Mca [Crossiella sp. SN42]